MEVESDTALGPDDLRHLTGDTEQFDRIRSLLENMAVSLASISATLDGLVKKSDMRPELPAPQVTVTPQISVSPSSVIVQDRPSKWRFSHIADSNGKLVETVATAVDESYSPSQAKKTSPWLTTKS